MKKCHRFRQRRTLTNCQPKRKKQNHRGSVQKSCERGTGMDEKFCRKNGESSPPPPVFR
jgi:hypothetical protein